jgi:citrate synthase
MTLVNCPTKEQEIEHYRSFLESLPRTCYLRSILGETLEQVADQISNDLAFPETLRWLTTAKLDAQQELSVFRKEAVQQRDKLKEEVRELERKVERSRNELAEIRSVASRLSRV